MTFSNELDKQEYQKMVAHLTREAIVFLAKLNAVSELRITTELMQGNTKLLKQIHELVQAALSGIWEEFNAKKLTK